MLSVNLLLFYTENHMDFHFTVCNNCEGQSKRNASYYLSMNILDHFILDAAVLLDGWWHHNWF